jgi:hypothetical protein
MNDVLTSLEATFGAQSSTGEDARRSTEILVSPGSGCEILRSTERLCGRRCTHRGGPRRWGNNPGQQPW